MQIQSYADIITGIVNNHHGELKVFIIFALAIGMMIAAYIEKL